jgi:excisionase family DNA binding protein
MVSGMTTQERSTDTRILLTPAEMAATLGVGRTTAYQLIASGEIPVVRIGRLVRVPVDGLREWIRAHETAVA